mmetsp:Transcript_19874/g.50122  ORF Transcript_19874/g.50122 Transcript_19874/m.50122 type:complete len:497 (-) Transcript_19874:158-1648(-)
MPPTKPVNAIVAQCPNRGIGNAGQLPWAKLPEDMKRFKTITSTAQQSGRRNAVLMGRKTWESIPAKFRPLDGRLNVVLTSNPGSVESAPETSKDVVVKETLAAAVEFCEASQDVESIFVIGGERVFTEAMPLYSNIYLTRVGKQFDCDVFFPVIDLKEFRPVEVTKTKSYEEIPFDFVRYARTPAAEEAGGSAPEVVVSGSPGVKLEHEELQYLDMIKDIVATGDLQGDRTGVGTIAKFGCQMRFSLRDGVFPLLTTKRVFWRGVLEELLWFLRGDTNGNHLSEKGIKIWDGNGSREFLDKRGLSHREVGDLGPVYGFQWRHFGAEYKDMHADYSGKGVDQVAELIETLKKNPTDRRMILTAWNPAALHEMALPPCHMFAQFYVNSQKELSCLLYQRSCDMGLGVPFNIASYAALTYMIAQCTGLKPGEFVHSMGNTHVYSNHVQPLMEQQVDRLPRPFPLLKLNPEKTDIDSFVFDDFTLIGYNPHPKVAMEMAV